MEKKKKPSVINHCLNTQLFQFHFNFLEIVHFIFTFLFI